MEIQALNQNPAVQAALQAVKEQGSQAAQQSLSVEPIESVPASREVIAVSPRPDPIAVFDKIQDVLDLSKQPRDTIGTLYQFRDGNVSEFLSVTAKLLSAGVTGYEVLDINGSPQTTFIEARIADQSARGADFYPQDRLAGRAPAL